MLCPMASPRARNCLRMLTAQQFQRVRRLALSRAGIELVDRHQQLLFHRGQRLGLANAEQFEAFLASIETGDSSAGEQLLRLITTGHTGFFRHPKHFELAATHAQRAVTNRGQARLWSAGAATGEEVWSLAMSQIESFERDDPPVSILATDLSSEALSFAARAEYGQQSIEAVSPERRERFFDETKPGRWTIKAAVRERVQFRAQNLAEIEWQVAGPFDVILCRNVLMYLEPAYRYAALEHMAALLSADGHLMLDPAEHLGKGAHLFTAGAGGVYRRRSPRLGSTGAGCADEG